MTDEWNGYKPLKKENPNFEQLKTDKGNGSPDLDLHIMNIKGWLRMNLEGYMAIKTNSDLST